MRRTTRTIRQRLWITLVIGLLLSMTLIVRLAYVQLWQGDKFTHMAEDNWKRDIPFSAKRGDVTDRNGIPLTYSVTTPSILVIPAQVKDALSASTQLAQILNESPDVIYRQMTKRSLMVRIQPSGRHISLDVAHKVRQLQIQGIVITEDYQRFYPFGGLAAHVLGFTGVDHQGLTGVEARFNSQLSGIPGNVSFMADAAGRALTLPHTSTFFAKPQQGLHMQLTIDVHLQSILERELDHAMLHYQPQSVIAIMMDPQTGEILGLASRPGYLPEHYNQVPPHIYNRNLPIWMTYEPGSTFKIITLAAALEEQKIQLHQEHLHDPGFIHVAGARLRCWKRNGHGDQSFLQVVENSCNPGFVMMGQRLGAKKLFSYIQQFGFGQKTGIDLAGEENGILFSLSKVGPVELATTSFGQGVSVTPIQQITAVSAAINGGILFQPYLTKAWIHPETGEVLQRNEPNKIRRIISEQTSRQVRETLESVVAKGTGRNAFLDGYRVGGKTGTAQKVVNGRYSKDEHIVSFIGFAPADDPQVIIYLAVDNPKGVQFGGLIAAPIVKNMMADALRYLKVEPRTDQIAKEYRYGEQPFVEVPDLVGLSISEIHQELTGSFSITSSGQGQVVASQMPKAGTRVAKGSTIRIFLAN